MKANILKLPEEHPELKGQFDASANLWGWQVYRTTPKGFAERSLYSEAGRRSYLMVYAPEGPHNWQTTNIMRRKFHALKTVEERLAMVDRVYDRAWDADYPLYDNLKNVARNLLGRYKGYKIGILDMLEPTYNWVIPLDVIEGWMKQNGFSRVKVLNPNEKHKCAHHVLGVKAG